MKKWITFDLDGTLIENPFSKWVFPEIEKLVLENAAADLKVVRALVAEHKKRLAEHHYVDAYDWDDILERFLKEHDIHVNIDIEQLVLRFSVYPKVYLLENDILDSLQNLIDKGYSLAAVTNGFYKYQFPVIKTLGLDTFFDEVITPCNTGYGKPDTRMVEKLLKQGDIIAHVGDRIDHDVYFANQLGAKSVLIDKNMPKKIKCIDPIKRNTQTEYIGTLDKNDTVQDTLDKRYVSDIIIHSIMELPKLTYQ